MEDTKMEIRFVKPEEVQQLARNVQTAFPSKTPQALLDNMPGELVHPDEGRYLGCFDDDGTMIGSLLMMDFEMNVRGKMMKMGAPAYVSTSFLHKKRACCEEPSPRADGSICADGHSGRGAASV